VVTLAEETVAVAKVGAAQVEAGGGVVAEDSDLDSGLGRPLQVAVEEERE